MATAPSKRTWQERVDAFVRAVDVGIAVYKECGPPPDEDGLPHPSVSAYARESRKLAKMAKDAGPPFANAKSLAYLEDAFFTFWNESHGRHVQKLWASVAERGLPYERNDVIGKAIKRGKIRTQIEYEHVTDARPSVSGSTRRTLDDMLAAFEASRSRKRN
jgi:hypothetical protein